MAGLSSECWGAGAMDEGENLGLLRICSGEFGAGLVRVSEPEQARLWEEVQDAVGSVLV